ncbi:hypothetical protein EVAR_40355_1 [Eumeta japonica]|uniref:Uncharacterized protein n=1 Tax=Eumeta variegata TaxID=151549 RepID=A0A4C1XNF6_EUMVA|nr:hypothetical protein EVAR_40355_1 [Eumeta japonica]
MALPKNPDSPIVLGSVPRGRERRRGANRSHGLFFGNGMPAGPGRVALGLPGHVTPRFMATSCGRARSDLHPASDKLE